MEQAGNPRMDIAHIATNMYAERVKEEQKAGQSELFANNPDARQLYFKGVHDVLTCLEVWLKCGVPPERLSQFMDELHAQTAPIANGTTH
jgi:hypothetical protein